MRLLKRFIGFSAVIVALSCCLVTHVSIAQTAGIAMKKTMTLTAEIDKIRGNYILRAEKPAEVFTVLNPHPNILKQFMVEGETVQVEVQFVSGDNVNITTINGIKYPEDMP